MPLYIAYLALVGRVLLTGYERIIFKQVGTGSGSADENAGVIGGGGRGGTDGEIVDGGLPDRPLKEGSCSCDVVNKRSALSALWGVLLSLMGWSP